MGSETPDRELYRPNEGEVGYAAKINANFDELDDVVPEYDDVANAPATDGFIVYITGDGPTTPEGHYQRLSGSYVEIGSGGGSGSAVEVAEDGTSLTTDVTLIDVLGGLTASEPVADEIDLAVDESEVDHDALLNFVANEHIDHSTVSVLSGTGLTGGGDLTADRTLTLDLPIQDSGTAVNTFDTLDFGTNLSVTDNTDGSATVDASGGGGVDVENTDGTALVAGATAIQAGTDLSFTDDGDGTATLDSSASGGSAVEVAEDGTSLTTDVTLIDVLGGLTASEPVADQIDLAIDETEVDHDALLNFVSNEHVDHSTVSILAGTALTGGGDITADRTLNVDETVLDHDNLTNYVANEHTDYRQDLINSPNAPFQSVELQDSANSESGADEYIQFTELVDAAETLTVYRWGAYDTSDGTAPVGLDVQLIEGDGTVNTSANTADNASLTGVASYSPASGTEVVKLRVLNGTGSDITSVGGCFAYRRA